MRSRSDRSRSIRIPSPIATSPALLRRSATAPSPSGRSPDVKERLLAGYTVGDRTFKVHIDGYNQLPYLTGQEAKSARPRFV